MRGNDSRALARAITLEDVQHYDQDFTLYFRNDRGSLEFQLIK
jgi:hypothetical protein